MFLIFLKLFRKLVFVGLASVVMSRVVSGNANIMESDTVY